MCVWCSEECCGVNWEAKLITDLLRDYNKYARPTINVSEPIHTTIAFYLTKILGLVSKIHTYLSCADRSHWLSLTFDIKIKAKKMMTIKQKPLQQE